MSPLVREDRIDPGVLGVEVLGRRLELLFDGVGSLEECCFGCCCEEDDSLRTLAKARSLVEGRFPWFDVSPRPADCDRGVDAGDLLESASDCRSNDLARRLLSSIFRLYSRALSNTDERLECVDLYDVFDLASLS